MSNAFIEISQSSLNEELARILLPQVEALLTDRYSGHCIRISDLDNEVMEFVCTDIRKRYPNKNIFILSNNNSQNDPKFISSTKLVELRNAQNINSDGPLIVFLPHLLRTSAEDSFGVATFEDISFDNLYKDLISSLNERIPVSLSPYINNIFDILQQEDWNYLNDVSKSKFLLTALENGIDGETIGASLYEISLIPDFKLFQDPSNIMFKIQKNLECVRKLINSYNSLHGRISEINLKEKKLVNQLVSFFNKYDIHDPENWTKKIAIETAWWVISFDKWEFKDDKNLDKVELKVTEVDLPHITENENNELLSGLIGQQVLVPNDRNKMAIVFEVNPYPCQINGLDSFSVQLISEFDGPVGKSKKVNKWKQKKAQSKVTLTKLNKIDFQEGWHRIKVLPWTKEGDILPNQTVESEPFYVLPDGKLEEEPPQQRIPYEKSLEHALLKFQIEAMNNNEDFRDIKLKSIYWDINTKNKKQVKQEVLEAKLSKKGTVRISASKVLKEIEQRILLKPKNISSWRMQINQNIPEPPSETSIKLPSDSLMQSFLSSRFELFNNISNESNIITQGFSFQESKDLCLSYAESYLDLINGLLKQAEQSSGPAKQTSLLNLKNLLSLDSVHTILVDFRGKYKECVLLSPTHPLRILWLLCWSNLGQEWLQKLEKEGKDYLTTIRHILTDNLQPINFPVGIPVEDGRIFTFTENITPFWGVFSSIKEDNVRGLIAEICSSFGLPQPATAGNEINSSTIEDKIERYLAQHPYIKELSINVFNPGSGTIISEAIKKLQDKPEYIDLRYNIRLFSVDIETPTLGEAFELLIKPDYSNKEESADVFSSSTGNHLFSKIKLAKYHLKEFQNNSKQFIAHLSIMLDVFPAEELSTKKATDKSVPFYGLIQDFENNFIDDDSGTFWQKSPITGLLINEEIRDSCFDLLTHLCKKMNYAISSIATSGASYTSVPMITLSLNVSERELIYQVHQVSDWVFTIDKNMGIEFFDHGGQKNRPDYLIDFTPGENINSTHNLIISSRSVKELEAMLEPVLNKYKLKCDQKQIEAILYYLRSLSGQLALKLISTSNQQTEAFGLALARLYLEYQGALSNQIIVPLDSHTNLYHLKGSDEDTREEMSLKRTDLALFDLNLEKRIITCNLVEVKCYSSVGDYSAFNFLKEQISQQINQSERIIQRHFDTALKTPDRPDRLLKSKELAIMLRFYLDRSVRYNIFDKQAAMEANAFLNTIENGYSLRFSRSAIIFDFEKDGTETPDKEVNIEFHRIGSNLIKELLDNCSIDRSHEKETTFESGSNLSEQVISTVPKLNSAAFLAPRRERFTKEDLNELSFVNLDEIDIQQENESDLRNDKDIFENKTNEKAEPVLTEKPKSDEKSKLDNRIQPSKKDDNSEDLIEANPLKNKELSYDILIGDSSNSPQYGILGEVSGRKIALDLNNTHTISLFGVQGGGKSYTLGTIIEMASMTIENINRLPSPLASVIFHYSATQDYSPEFTSMINSNSVEKEIEILSKNFNGSPKALENIVILTSKDKVEERKIEYPNIEVKPIAFSATELKASHWKFLMGAIGSQSMYMRQINQIMRRLRNDLTLSALEHEINNSTLSDHLKELALTRLRFAGEYIDDSQKLQELIYPGRLVIVDLRDEFIEKDEALGLFVVMLQVISEATCKGNKFNKLVVFDEAHKYIESQDLISGLVEVVREMRHKGTSIMVASQDPPSVPVPLIELSNHIIMHKFNSPAWLKHIQKANAALSELTSEKMSHLGTGEAYIWSSKSSDDSFSKGAIKIKCRPRVTQHGGSTKTAVT